MAGRVRSRQSEKQRRVAERDTHHRREAGAHARAAWAQPVPQDTTRRGSTKPSPSSAPAALLPGPYIITRSTVAPTASTPPLPAASGSSFKEKEKKN